MAATKDRSFLAIDYGSRRIGLAKSDPLGMIASALKTLTVSSMNQALEEVKTVIDEYHPAGLIVGYPLLASGDRSAMCGEIDKFIGHLEAMYDGEIHRVDEQYSSREATAIINAHGKKSGSRKAAIDRLAAVIILQRFLDDKV